MKWTLLLVAALLILLFGKIMVSCSAVRDKLTDHASPREISGTIDEMSLIADAMFNLGVENHSEFSKLTNQIRFTLSRELADKLASYFHWSLRQEFAKRSGSSRKLLDRWGSEFTMQLRLQPVGSEPGVERALGYELIISSNGHNRLDELGKGDDIVLGPKQIILRGSIQRK